MATSIVIPTTLDLTFDICTFGRTLTYLSRDSYSGVNRSGNVWTSHRDGNPGEFTYENNDGSRFHDAGQGEGRFYQNPRTESQWLVSF